MNTAWIKDAAKFWIAVGGALVTSATAQFALPLWVTWVAGAITAIAVYIVPNTDKSPTVYVSDVTGETMLHVTLPDGTEQHFTQ